MHHFIFISTSSWTLHLRLHPNSRPRLHSTPGNLSFWCIKDGAKRDIFLIGQLCFMILFFVLFYEIKKGPSLTSQFWLSAWLSSQKFAPFHSTRAWCHSTLNIFVFFCIVGPFFVFFTLLPSVIQLLKFLPLKVLLEDFFVFFSFLSGVI